MIQQGPVKGHLQNSNLFCLKTLARWVKFSTYGAHSNVVGADTIANHPTQLYRKLTAITTVLNTMLTFASTRNFRIVDIKSLPINSPVCLPTGELNSIRCFLSCHFVSSFGGESINEMLKDVNGRRCRVDHPSQTVEILEGMRYNLVRQEWGCCESSIRTSMISIVTFSSCFVLVSMAEAMDDLRGMSSSRTLEFR
jgi:hypothetical protein